MLHEVYKCIGQLSKSTDVPYLGEDIDRLRVYLRGADIEGLRRLLREYQVFDKHKTDPIEHYVKRVNGMLSKSEQDEVDAITNSTFMNGSNSTNMVTNSTTPLSSSPPASSTSPSSQSIVGHKHSLAFNIVSKSGRILQSSDNVLLKKLKWVEEQNVTFLQWFPTGDVPILPQIEFSPPPRRRSTVSPPPRRALTPPSKPPLTSDDLINNNNNNNNNSAGGSRNGSVNGSVNGSLNGSANPGRLSFESAPQAPSSQPPPSQPQTQTQTLDTSSSSSIVNSQSTLRESTNSNTSVSLSASLGSSTNSIGATNNTSLALADAENEELGLSPINQIYRPEFGNVEFAILVTLSIHSRKFTMGQLVQNSQSFCLHDMYDPEVQSHLPSKLMMLVANDLVGNDGSDLYYQSGAGKDLGRHFHDIWFDRDNFLKKNQLTPSVAQTNVVVVIDQREQTKAAKLIETFLCDMGIRTVNRKLTAGDFAFIPATQAYSETLSESELYPFTIERKTFTEFYRCLTDQNYGVLMAKRSKFTYPSILQSGGWIYIVEGEVESYKGTGAPTREEYNRLCERMANSESFRLLHTDSVMGTSKYLAMMASILDTQWGSRPKLKFETVNASAIRNPPLTQLNVNSPRSRFVIKPPIEFFKEYIFSTDFRERVGTMIDQTKCNQVISILIANNAVGDFRQELASRLDTMLQNYLSSQKTQTPMETPYFTHDNLLQIDHIDPMLIDYYILHMNLILGVRFIATSSDSLPTPTSLQALNDLSQDIDQLCKLPTTFGQLFSIAITSKNREVQRLLTPSQSQSNSQSLSQSQSQQQQTLSQPQPSIQGLSQSNGSPIAASQPPPSETINLDDD
ncbi:hypothetical protein SAMD00019534_047470 [Acytostelium subglobosum LB1]|uniref:hypothetical protein n=1 Tax=Acytostelium subglobosum LB1 TaxID=1410327 RepID=UPI0006447B22|nr:hypothetical protein SAMD00019534_047470 [Acytostelium subglobosum LB1]GAM21572.1 hypothetical protein SAMD00019534_047470 [Acytostelium subglobosum LB1]|eukprot:XP_012755691.1 hypothetical protein SAMD00019534_047470 [Acytostelium subglobosum LB1]